MKTKSKNTIHIAVADDHKLFRKGLVALLNDKSCFDVVLEAYDGIELFSKLDELESSDNHKPDILLLDLKMPNQNGFDCLEKIKDSYSWLNVIVVSMFEEPAYVIKAIKAGAKSFILKSEDPKIVIEAIESVYNSGFYINDRLGESLINNLKTTTKPTMNTKLMSTDLSTLEMRVLELICDGMTNQEISKAIFKSVRTIEGYRQRLLEKTHNKNTASLVAWAIRNNIVE